MLAAIGPAPPSRLIQTGTSRQRDTTGAPGGANIGGAGPVDPGSAPLTLLMFRLMHRILIVMCLLRASIHPVSILRVCRMLPLMLLVTGDLLPVMVLIITT